MKIIKTIFNSPITYKVSNDILMIMLLFTILFLIFETILPGIISNYISPFLLFISLFGLVLFIFLVSKIQSISIPTKKYNKFFLILATIFFAIIIGIAGYKYGFLFDSIITIFAITFLILAHYSFKEIIKS